MSIQMFEGPSTNAEIDALANRVFSVVRLSLERGGAAMTGAPQVNLPARGLERDAHDFLANLQKTDRTAAMRLAGRTRAATPVVARPTFAVRPTMAGAGQAFRPDFTSPTPVLEQARKANFFAGVRFSPETIAQVRYDASSKRFLAPASKEDYADRIAQALAFKRGVLTPTVSSGATRVGSTGSGATRPPDPAREVRLKIASLKALRRTGFEISDWGDDVIHCGGSGVDATQQIVKAPPFYVHKFQRDGENFDIKPDRTLLKFDLTRSTMWPRSFAATVHLAEKDADGGFLTFLQQLWDAIGDEVIQIASTLAVAAAGAAIGATVGTELMPIVGTIIGAVVGAVIGLLVDWFMNSLKDDIFDSADNPLTLVMTDPTDRFPGGELKSPVQTQEFTVGQARYFMKYYWEIAV